MVVCVHVAQGSVHVRPVDRVKEELNVSVERLHLTNDVVHPVAHVAEMAYYDWVKVNVRACILEMIFL